MLQNRVDPSGNIISTSARGAWMGNRGVIHDHDKRIQRPFRLKAWLICVLEFKNRKRQVMMPDRWTELFFLDEATALSAGHRPCFECRRKDSDRFKASWCKGNPEYHFDAKTPIAEIDAVLHGERIDRLQQKVTYQDDIRGLPDGVFIAYNDKPYVIEGACLYPWSAAGYGEPIVRPPTVQVTVLTPQSTVNAFRRGYKPQVALPL
jgi:hypothetical protein